MIISDAVVMVVGFAAFLVQAHPLCHSRTAVGHLSGQHVVSLSKGATCPTGWLPEPNYKQVL